MCRGRWRRFDIVALSGCLILLAAAIAAFCAPTGASELTRGKKALFSENFELDIYEWTLMEKGEKKGEDPDLITTEEAYQGRNALLFAGRKGILALELAETVKGLVELRGKFPAPHDYTRMFGIGLGEDEVLLGVNRSQSFAYAVGGVWRTSDVPVDEKWHTFTYDLSGAVAKAYIDGRFVAEAPGLQEFDRVKLGINNGRGGRCLVDAVVVYGVETAISEEDAIEVEIPLEGLRGDLQDHGRTPAFGQICGGDLLWPFEKGSGAQFLLPPQAVLSGSASEAELLDVRRWLRRQIERAVQDG